MVRVAVVYHSGTGRTKLQAEAVLRGAASVAGAEAEIITSAEACERLDDLDGFDAIIFGCPTYMGNLSAEFKKFMEAAVGKWFKQAWKDKIAGGFTTSAQLSGDKLNTMTSLAVFAMQHSMIWVGTGTMPPSIDDLDGVGGKDAGALENRLASFFGPMASHAGSATHDTPPEGDLATAEAYGKRVAEVAGRMG